MKAIFKIVLFMLMGIAAKAQLPSSTFRSRIFTGNTEAQWLILDSPLVNFVGPSLFNARYPGTQFVKIGGGDTAFYFGAGGNLWFRSLLDRDTISLSNRINLKLNITDTTNRWWGLGKRWVDTVYRKNDSTIGYTINGGAEQTFQILGRSSSSPGGGLTSVGLSMPSAFSVSGSPLTSNGTINVSGSGTTAQYIRGNGTLATTDTGMIPNFYLKVRSLLSGTSPITYNSTTGAIGIPNANNTGQKGAATFNNTDFIDNGAGLISLRNPAAFPGVDSIWRVPGIDSIYFTINSNQHTILDSAGATVTANNGLTKTSNNIQLGGALIQATNITSAVGANRIIYSGVSASGDGAQLDVSTTGSVGIAVRGSSTDGRGIFGTATTGVGVYGSATSSGGIGVFSTTTDGSAIYSTTNAAGLLFEGVSIPSSTNTAIPVISLTRSSQSAGANGIGGSIDMNLHTTLADRQSNRIVYKLTTATDASYTSSMEFWNANSATVARKASLAGSGQWTWDGYPSLTAQTDTSTWKPIVIDSSGNVGRMIGWAGAGGAEKDIDVFLVAGQSNAVGHGDSTLSPAPIIGKTFQINSGIITPAKDPIGINIGSSEDRATYGSAWPQFCNTYFNRTSRMVCVIPSSRGGTSQTAAGDVGNGNWDTTGVLFDSAVARVNSSMAALIAAGYNPIFKGVMWLQGESDAIAYEAGTITVTDYTNAFEKMLRRFRQNFGASMPFYVIQIGTSTTHADVPWWQDIRNAQQTVANQDSLTTIVYYNARNFITRGLLVDNIHYNQIGLNEVGQLSAYAVTSHMKNIIQTQASNIWYPQTMGVGAAPTNGFDFEIAGRNPNGNGGIAISNTSTGSSATSMVRFYNSAGINAHIWATGTGAGSNIGGAGTLVLYAQQSGGIRLVNFGGGDIVFSKSAQLANGSMGRFTYGNGNFLFNTETDNNSNGKFQVNSTSWFNGLMKLSGVTSPPGAYNILVHGLSDSGTYQIPVSSIGGTTIYNGDDTLSGNRTVTGANNNLIFSGINQFRVYSNYLYQAKADGTRLYASAIDPSSTGSQAWQFGYAPFTRGVGLYVDTLNNVGLGDVTQTSMPLYTTGNSAYVRNGLQSQQGNFYSVTNVTTTSTLGVTVNFVTVDATSGNITITLPAASASFGSNMGLDIIFKRLDNSANTITISRAGADLIDGATTFTLTSQYQSKQIRAISSSAWAIY